MADRQRWWPVGNLQCLTHYERHRVSRRGYYPPDDPNRNPRVHVWYVKGGVCDFGITRSERSFERWDR